MMKDDKINEIVESHFIKKSNFSLETMIAMVEDQMRVITPLLEKKQKIVRLIKEAEERVVRFPKIKITERWGEKNNEDREILETLMSRVVGGTVDEKITSVNSFLTYKPGLSVPDILSNLMFVEIFSNIIEEYNDSTAGFLFEAFLAGLFSGIQVSDPEQIGMPKGSLPIVDANLAIRKKDQPDDEIVPYSLKVLSPTTWLKGSYKNLVDHFALGGVDIVYLVVTKERGGTLAFNEFEISQKNFLEYIGHEKYKKEPVYKPIEFLPAELINPKRRGKKNPLGPGTYFQVNNAWLKKYKVRNVTTIDNKEVPLNTDLDPNETYVAYRWGGEEEMRPQGGLTATARKLYGGEEGYKAALAAQYDNGFWEYLKTTNGYINEKQFAISPDNYRKRSNNLGKLDLHPQKLIKLANAYAEDLGASLVNLYNAVSDLSINVNRYFIASDKAAGMSAITNANTVQIEANNIIEPGTTETDAPPIAKQTKQQPPVTTTTTSAMPGTRQRAKE